MNDKNNLTPKQVELLKKLMVKKGIKKIERITLTCPYEDILVFTFGDTKKGESWR